MIGSPLCFLIFLKQLWVLETLHAILDMLKWVLPLIVKSCTVDWRWFIWWLSPQPTLWFFWNSNNSTSGFFRARVTAGVDCSAWGVFTGLQTASAVDPCFVLVLLPSFQRATISQLVGHVILMPRGPTTRSTLETLPIVTHFSLRWQLSLFTFTIYSVRHHIYIYRPEMSTSYQMCDVALNPIILVPGEPWQPVVGTYQDGQRVTQTSLTSGLRWAASSALYHVAGLHLPTSPAYRPPVALTAPPPPHCCPPPVSPPLPELLLYPELVAAAALHHYKKLQNILWFKAMNVWMKPTNVL
jgi:hypothetical protein